MSTHNPYAPKKQVSEAEAPKAEAQEVEASETLEVPEGSITKIMKWVDGDPARAKAAYEAENSEEKPRVSLLGQLEELF